MTDLAPPHPAVVASDRVPAPPSATALAVWVALATAIVLLAIVQLTVGVVYIPLSEVLTLLSGGASDDVWSRIVLDFRVPRALAALVAGAGLGVCGLLLQTIFRNPLADPWLLGLVNGARLGVAGLVVVAGAGGSALWGGLGLVSNVGLAVAAGLGAGGLTALLVAIAPRVSPVTLLLTGLMLGQTADGLINVVLHFTTEAQARAFSSWNDGTFTTVTLTQWAVMLAAVASGVSAAVALVKPLNTLLLGDDYARTLGLSVNRIRIAVVSSAALLAGAVTAFCGPVAFLGILAPHVARALFVTADHRTLLPAAALVGAALALTADVVTHLPWSRHFLHMNAVLGLIGGPTIVVLLLRGRSLRQYEA